MFYKLIANIRMHLKTFFFLFLDYSDLNYIENYR